MKDRTKISATEPDWTRERPRCFWDLSRKLLAAIRAYERSGWLGRKWATFRHRFWSVVTGAELYPGTHIGGGLVMTHPNGIVVHPKARIGPNCLLMHQVTLGMNRGGFPTLGGHVDIGPGAKILGPVTIGDHAVIGANAVVLQDVPAGAVAVGVPAKVLLGNTDTLS